MDYYFFFIFQRSTFKLEKKTKAFVKENFRFTHTSNRLYLLWNCFSNYVHLKDLYITLKGIGKVLLVSVSRILLICNFLNFTAAVTKKINIKKFAYKFSCEKVNFSRIHPTHIAIPSLMKSTTKFLGFSSYQ